MGDVALARWREGRVLHGPCDRTQRASSAAPLPDATYKRWFGPRSVKPSDAPAALYTRQTRAEPASRGHRSTPQASWPIQRCRHYAPPDFETIGSDFRSPGGIPAAGSERGRLPA